MKYVKLGNTGTDVSRICLGMMSFGKPGKEHGLFPWAKDFDDAKPIFKKAIELGINYFDTANVYQLGTSEEVTGQLIREFDLDRDEHQGANGDAPWQAERQRLVAKGRAQRNRQEFEAVAPGLCRSVHHPSA